MHAAVFIHWSILPSNEEVREEGRKGLKYPRDEDTMAATPPAFTSMVLYFHQKVISGSEVGCTMVNLYDLQCAQRGTTYTTAAGALPLPPASMVVAIRFLQLCLHVGAGVTEEQKDTHEALELLVRHLKESGNIA